MSVFGLIQGRDEIKFIMTDAQRLALEDGMRSAHREIPDRCGQATLKAMIAKGWITDGEPHRVTSEGKDALGWQIADQIGQHFSYVLKQYGVTQDDAARLLGVNASVIDGLAMAQINIGIVYGILWHAVVDQETGFGCAVHFVRNLISEKIVRDHDERGDCIKKARSLHPGLMAAATRTIERI